MMNYSIQIFIIELITSNVIFLFIYLLYHEDTKQIFRGKHCYHLPLFPCKVTHIHVRLTAVCVQRLPYYSD